MCALNNMPSQNFINISHLPCTIHRLETFGVELVYKLICTIHRLETFGVELVYKLINFNERH